MSEFLTKLILALAPPTATLLLAALCGQRLTAWWTEKQKRRELELALANNFYAGYGEFCAVWKEWNYLLHRSADTFAGTDPQFVRLHERACRAEGNIEAVLLKISVERLIPRDCAAELGSLRQAFQVLRERIQDGKPISYGWSGHPDYLEFKRLTTYLGTLLAARSGTMPSDREAYDSFVEITDNRHETRWMTAGR